MMSIMTRFKTLDALSGKTRSLASPDKSEETQRDVTSMTESKQSAADTKDLFVYTIQDGKQTKCFMVTFTLDTYNGTFS